MPPTCAVQARHRAVHPAGPVPVQHTWTHCPASHLQPFQQELQARQNHRIRCFLQVGADEWVLHPTTGAIHRNSHTLRQCAFSVECTQNWSGLLSMSNGNRLSDANAPAELSFVPHPAFVRLHCWPQSASQARQVVRLYAQKCKGRLHPASWLSEITLGTSLPIQELDKMQSHSGCLPLPLSQPYFVGEASIPGRNNMY